MDRLRSAQFVCLLLALSTGGFMIADIVTGPMTEQRTAVPGEPSDAVSLISTESDYRPDNLTIVTSVSGAISSAQEKGALFVVKPSGDIAWQEHRYNVYDDVDPSPLGSHTVTFVSAEKLTGSECAEFEASPCTRNFIERLNFTTGERERLFVRKTPHVVDSRWHDADRINETHFAIADISQERLIIVNIQTDTITYEWRMEEAFSRETTGAIDEPNDWAHLNDVEVLPGGVFMLSPRNHDQVIFVRPGEGLLPERTLGEDENYDIIYEQHNPDYLTSDRGNDSVLLADSQNNRIIEYAYRGNTWKESWVWTDKEMRWPRDADRLPNGNTLISDTSSGRIIEVSPEGDVLWGLRIKGNYEAERLGTGDESTGGPPMATIEPTDEVQKRTNSILPPPVRRAVNGVLFVSPPWASMSTLFFAAGFLISSTVFGIVTLFRHWHISNTTK